VRRMNITIIAQKKNYNNEQERKRPKSLEGMTRIC
jgi:hypothetical protein